MFPINLGFCCLCSCTCLLTSGYMECYLISLSLTGSSPSWDSGCVTTPQSPAVSVILWFWDLVIMRSWVCQSSWESICLWDPEILVWPSSWDPVTLVVSELLRVQLSLWFCDLVILRSWVCQSSWESSCLWDPEILVWPKSWDPGILGSCGPRSVVQGLILCSWVY